jgi:hypothetical protein
VPSLEGAHRAPGARSVDAVDGEIEGALYGADGRSPAAETQLDASLEDVGS